MANRVPVKDSEFDSYIRNTSAALADGTPTGADRLGLSASEATQWASYLAEWTDIYTKYTDPAKRTTAVTQAKNNTKKNFTEFSRIPLGKIALSGALTSDDRSTFNLPERDTTPTARGPITEVPVGNIKGSGGGMVEIRARRGTDASRPSLHPLADAVELRYQIMTDSSATDPTNPDPARTDQVPTPDDCPQSAISKSALWRINTGTQYTGKRIIGFIRWVNLTNPANNSGWSDLMTTIIS